MLKLTPHDGTYEGASETGAGGMVGAVVVGGEVVEVAWSVVVVVVGGEVVVVAGGDVVVVVGGTVLVVDSRVVVVVGGTVVVVGGTVVVVVGIVVVVVAVVAVVGGVVVVVAGRTVVGSTTGKESDELESSSPPQLDIARVPARNSGRKTLKCEDIRSRYMRW